MPELTERLTNTTAARLPAPSSGYLIHWCKNTGLGVRVSATGDRAYVAQRRVDGKTVRRTLGKATGPGAISIDAARRLQVDVSSELQLGVDRLETKREKRRQDKADNLTFADALRAYTKTKHRAKDGLPLKARTVADYIEMIEPEGTTKTGRPTLAGELHTLAHRPLHKITAADIRAAHEALKPRGDRRQAYAMQVLRAVLRFHGVAIDDNPLSPTTAGVQRVRVAPSKGNPSPIPTERLRAWWKAACDIKTTSADQLRFQLITGCRPGEIATVKVEALDIEGRRLKLTDTKNRKDHVVYLSKQALKIAVKHAKGKRPGALLFGVTDTGKTMASINAAAEVVGATPHKLRHTFASVADDLVTAATARAMLNHAGGDVAEQHYIAIDATKLRAGWQAVADFITGAAK